MALAHFSERAESVKSIAQEAIEEGIHAGKRAMKRVRRGVDRLEDVKEEAARRIKRQPFPAAGVFLGAGLLLGVAVGWMTGRFVRQGCRR
jgi:hypothetical protein